VRRPYDNYALANNVIITVVKKVGLHFVYGVSKTVQRNFLLLKWLATAAVLQNILPFDLHNIILGT